MNPLSLYLAWRARRRSARALQAAERRRAAIIAQKEHRKAKHGPFRYLDGDLRQATNDSLRAYLRGAAHG